ncbi:MAG: class I SAM-dependent rRNA methyltransferase [Chitinophagales bacterium]
MQNPQVVIHQNKADAVKRYHPWIFSGAIKRKDREVIADALVDAIDEKGNFLACGYYSDGSIAVRVLSFRPFDNLSDFFEKRLQQAWQLRVAAGLTAGRTNCFRLCNAEGDGVPGLIIDIYDNTAVLQAHSPYIFNQRQIVAKALQHVTGSRLSAIYCKSEAALGRKSGLAVQDHYLLGSRQDANGMVLENGLQFAIDWQDGQKTGFFLDQRDNRQLLGQYAKNKKVLNTFCYTGGFSVYALAHGASMVHSVDSSQRAMELTDRNVALNGATSAHTSYTTDVFDFFKNQPTNAYDLIVLDPPAFAKGHHARHQAVQAYKRLNQTAFEKIQHGGIVFTFSCSQAVGRDLFEGAVMAAAIEAGRNIKVLHHLSQPADHPQSIFHSEGMYLKGLVLYVS